MPSPSCVVCQRKMSPGLLRQTWRCPDCGFQSSEFESHININSRIALDERRRAQGLHELRSANFSLILKALEPLLAQGASVLDIGCAHGWFLEQAQAAGYQVYGIEPDQQIATEALERGLNVLSGYYPDALTPGQTYDVTIFNDTLEHLPYIDNMILSLHHCVCPGGYVVVNLPVSDGVIFHTAELFARAGFKRPLQRLWQQGFPSPHLSYFSRTTLPRLFDQLGFELLTTAPIPTLGKGVRDRIAFDPEVRPLEVQVYALMADLLRVMEPLTQSDTRFFIFRKKQ